MLFTYYDNIVDGISTSINDYVMHYFAKIYAHPFRIVSLSLKFDIQEYIKWLFITIQSFKMLSQQNGNIFA